LAMKTVVLLRRAGISKHHHRIPRSRHQVVVLFDNLPVLAVIETKLVPPIVKMPENFEASALHPDQHVLNAGLKRHRAAIELRVVVQHIEPLRLILVCKRLARAFQCLAPAVARPGPGDLFAPGLQSSSMDDRRGLGDAIRLAHVNRVGVAIPNQLDRSERMIPPEIHSADARPMTGKLAMLDCKRLFGNGENAARAEYRNPTYPGFTLMHRV